jgi:hypothetical protein
MPYLGRVQRRLDQLEANTLRDVEDARMQTSLRNMLVHMARVMEMARSEVSMTRADRREYITNALRCKVSGASVTLK